MDVIPKLSSATGKRNKLANKAFAQEVAHHKNSSAIEALVALLDHADRNIQSDAIEVLYECGYVNPDLIAAHHQIFVALLANKNNRLVWGAMIALMTISKIDPQTIFHFLPQITAAMAIGSVITKDAGVALLANLATVDSQRDVAFSLLKKELAACPPKQLPQYVEKSIIAVVDQNQAEFMQLIEARIPDLDKPSQLKRINKALKSLK